MHFFTSIPHKIGVAVLCGFLLLGFCMWKGVNPLSGEDISNSLQDEEEQVVVKQFLRYCKPSFLHRVGNGFDSATCREKLTALADYESNKGQALSYSADIQGQIDSNIGEFQERLRHGKN